MSQYKIIFTGPVGAGKTTAIQSISDVPPIKTDASASDMTKLKKAVNNCRNGLWSYESAWWRKDTLIWYTWTRTI